MLKRILGSVFLGDQIKEGEIGAACRTHGGEDNYVEFSWGILKERTFGRPGRRWDVNTIIELKEIGRKLTGLSWLRLGTNNWCL